MEPYDDKVLVEEKVELGELPGREVEESCAEDQDDMREAQETQDPGKPAVPGGQPIQLKEGVEVLLVESITTGNERAGVRGKGHVMSTHSDADALPSVRDAGALPAGQDRTRAMQAPAKVLPDNSVS